MVFCWTLTHLHWPEIEADDNTWESAVLRVMQPPEQPPPFAAPILFSVFYSLVHVYSFMLTIIYWAVLVPNGHGHLPHDRTTATTPCGPLITSVRGKKLTSWPTCRALTA